MCPWNVTPANVGGLLYTVITCVGGVYDRNVVEEPDGLDPVCSSALYADGDAAFSPHHQSGGQDDRWNIEAFLLLYREREDKRK